MRKGCWLLPVRLEGAKQDVGQHGLSLRVRDLAFQNHCLRNSNWWEYTKKDWIFKDLENNIQAKSAEEKDIRRVLDWKREEKG